MQPDSRRASPFFVRLRAGVAAGALALALATTGPATGETLHDALIAAYLNNPTLLAQRANLRVTDEGVPQALSNYRPTVTAEGSAGRTERSDSTSGSTGLDPKTAALRVVQPLYRGGRTVASVRQAENLVLAGRMDLRTTEQSVLLLAVTAYMNVVRDQAVLQLRTNNETVLARQLQATRDRFEVGEVTRTDVAQSEARQARARSDRIQAEGDLTSSRANYRRVVGVDPGRLEPAPALADVPDSLESAIVLSVRENPSLKSAEYIEAASRDAVDVAKGALLPTVNLNGDLTYAEEAAVQNLRTEAASITARLTIPLYQAGAEYSSVRQSREANTRRRIQVEEARRSVMEGVTTAWQRLTTSSARIVAQREQVRASELALDGVRQEAEVGARTTLDILDAEQEFLNAQVTLVQAQRDEYVAAFELKSAVGRLTAQGVGLGVESYDETDYYRRVRERWTGLNGELFDGGFAGGLREPRQPTP